MSRKRKEEDIRLPERRLELRYEAPLTVGRFMMSEAMYRGLMGPRGSGKSSGSCWELMRRGMMQVPDSRGVRRTVMAVVRNTYKELEDTTLRTWLHWFPENVFGEMNRTKMVHRVKLNNPNGDGSVIEMEVLFRALDRPDDIKKVLSMELTGAWVNEAREVPKGLIDGLGDAVGRFPSASEEGCTWRGVIMDTNPPDDHHWWYRLAELDRPEGWEFFRQPGGLLEIDGEFVNNPEAENIQNLEKDYYLTRAAGKDPDHVRVYYCNQYGFVKEGKPVVPEYVDARHCLKEVWEPIKGLAIYVGLDFGLTPAAVFAQLLPTGRWVVFDELVTEDMGAVMFAEVLGRKFRGEYGAWRSFEIYGDPSGDYRSGTDEMTPFLILKQAGIEAYPAPTNDAVVRREALAVPLTRLGMDGEPRLMLSPKCKMLRKGLAGGYYYKRLRVRGEDRHHDKPSKNRYSHPVEALGYLLLGAGEGAALVSGSQHEEFKGLPGGGVRRFCHISSGGEGSWMAG